MKELRDTKPDPMKNDPMFLPPLESLRPGGEYDPLEFWAQEVTHSESGCFVMCVV